jgi:hypothetical protein
MPASMKDTHKRRRWLHNSFVCSPLPGCGPQPSTTACATGRDDFGRAVSRILSAPKPFEGENHLSQQPIPGTCSAGRNVERATPGSPIWPCTRWGFPCLRACAWSGGLLPHLFTLTPISLPRPGRFNFLWHYPSGRLAASPPACIPWQTFLRRPPQVTRHRALWCSDFPPPPNCSGESDSPPFQNHREYTRLAAR